MLNYSLATLFFAALLAGVPSAPNAAQNHRAPIDRALLLRQQQAEESALRMQQRTQESRSGSLSPAQRLQMETQHQRQRLQQDSLHRRQQLQLQQKQIQSQPGASAPRANP